MSNHGGMATSHAPRWAPSASPAPAGTRRRHARGAGRVSVAQLRTARRILGIVVVVELGVLAARLLEIAGFSPLVSAAAMAALTGNVLATWLIISRANHGRRQRGPSG